MDGCNRVQGISKLVDADTRSCGLRDEIESRPQKMRYRSFKVAMAPGALDRSEAKGVPIDRVMHASRAQGISKLLDV